MPYYSIMSEFQGNLQALESKGASCDLASFSSSLAQESCLWIKAKSKNILPTQHQRRYSL